MKINWLSIRANTPFLGRKFRWCVSTEHYTMNNFSYAEAKKYAEHYYYEHKESVVTFYYDKNKNKLDVREFIYKK